MEQQNIKANKSNFLDEVRIKIIDTANDNNQHKNRILWKCLALKITSIRLFILVML